VCWDFLYPQNCHGELFPFLKCVDTVGRMAEMASGPEKKFVQLIPRGFLTEQARSAAGGGVLGPGAPASCDTRGNRADTVTLSR